MSVPILIKRDTLAQCTAINPILKLAEPLFIIDDNGTTIGMKIGDGKKTFTELQEFKPGGDITPVQEALDMLELTVTTLQQNKENNLPTPEFDDQILSTTLDGIKTWITLPDYLLPDGSISMDPTYTPSQSNDIATLETVDNAVQNLEEDLGTPMTDSEMLVSSTTGSRSWMKVTQQRVYSGITTPTNDIGSNGDIYNQYTEKGSDFGIEGISNYLIGQDTPDTWVFDSLVNTVLGDDFIISYSMIFDRVDLSNSIISVETTIPIYNIKINDSYQLIITDYYDGTKYTIVYDNNSADFITTMASMFNIIDSSATIKIETNIEPLTLVPATQFIKSQDLWQEFNGITQNQTVYTETKKTRFTATVGQADFMCRYKIGDTAIVFVDGQLQTPDMYQFVDRLLVMKSPLPENTDVLIIE